MLHKKHERSKGPRKIAQEGEGKHLLSCCDHTRFPLVLLLLLRLFLLLFSQLVGRLPTFAQPKAIISRALGWGLRTNKRLVRVKAPMGPGTTKDGQKGMVPNVTSRFWLDDIPHGL